MLEIIGVFVGVSAVPCLLLGVIMLISFLTCDYIEKFVVKAFCSFKNRRRQRYRGKNNGGKVQPSSESFPKQQKFSPSAPQYQKEQEHQSPNPQNQRSEPFESIEEMDRHFHEEKYRLVSASGTSTRKKSRKFSDNSRNVVPKTITAITTDNAEIITPSENIPSSSSISSSSRQQEQVTSATVSSQSLFDEPPPSYHECFKQATQEHSKTTSVTKFSTSKEKSD